MRDLARFSTTALVLAGAMLCAGEQSRGQAGSGSTQFRVAHNRVWGIRLGVSDETWGDPNWHAPLGTGARLFLGNGDEPFARDGEQGVSVRVSTATHGGDPTLGGVATRERGGVAGISIAVGPVPESVTPIIPANGGVRLHSRSASDQTFAYGAWGWHFPGLLLQGPRSGVAIWTEDPRWRFVSVRVRRTSGRWMLALHTEADAPWASASRCESVAWRFRAYTGGWTAGASILRAAVSRRSGDRGGAPAWTRDIACVVRVIGRGEAKNQLASLARAVTPRRTLLYISDWRSHRYDVMYPDYTPAADAVLFIREAHRLGFRVMAHANLLGMSPLHPRASEFQPLVEVNPHGLGLEGWWLDRDTPGRIWCLNPAYRVVRRLLVDEMTASWRAARFDALHLVFPGISNSDHGRIDGANAIMGARDLVAELARAMPGVALGSEGHADFLLPAVLAMTGDAHLNDLQRDDEYHPIRAAVFDGMVHTYGHLGTPDQRTDLAPFLRYASVLDRLAALPPITMDRSMPFDPKEPGTRLALKRVALFTAWAPRPAFGQTDQAVNMADGTSGKIVSAWRAGGRSLLTVTSAAGHVSFTREDASVSRVVSRTFMGCTRLPAGWRLPGWVAASTAGVFGLCPTGLYLPVQGKPDAPIVLKASRPVRILGGRVARGAVVRVEQEPGAVDLTEEPLSDAGIVWNGRIEPVSRGATFESAFATSGGVRRRCLNAHPPYEGQSTERVGASTFGQFRVRVPDAPAPVFHAWCGLRDLPNGGTAGDGVRFSVLVGARKVASVLRADRAWQELTVPLVEWRGRDIVLRLETDAGPAGDAGYDWACWGEPAIDAGPTAADLELAPPAGADRLIVEDASGLRSIAPGSARVRVSLPAQLIYASGPTTAAVAGPLSGLPSETRTCIDGLVRSESAWGAGRDERFALAGEERSGIWAHPPERGQTRIAWLLKLPEGPMRLRTGAGVRALGGQVGFRIEVNGRTLWEHASSGGQPWQDADVDLAPWAGKEALVELVTDSLGSGNSDWALWSTPALVDKRK